MTRSELEEWLKAERIPKYAYSLDNGMPYEAWCIGRVASGWEVYFSERGYKRQRYFFTSEEEACDCLYSRLSELIDFFRRHP